MPGRFDAIALSTLSATSKEAYACEFCAASMRLSPVFRTKPVDKVLAEVRRLKELFGRPFIEFADDNTFADKRHGITVNGCFILGLDGDGPDSFEHVFRFVEDSGLYDVQITYLTPFPGTPLWTRLAEEGRLLSEEATERCTLLDINFRPTDMSVDELRDGFRKLARRLYAPEFVEQRSKRFREHLRAEFRKPAKVVSGV